MMQSDWSKIVEILQDKNLIRDPQKLKVDVTFQAQDIDSLDLAGVFLAIEDEFKIKLLDNPVRRPKSFRDILGVIERSRANA